MASSSFPSSGSKQIDGIFPVTMPSDEDRFHMDLEFVQCLSNAQYLHYLATEGYFESESFMKYLKYLRYWKEEKYITFITFPSCIPILDTLLNDDHPQFREFLKDPAFAEYLHKDQGLRWQGLDVIEHFANMAATTAQNANMASTTSQNAPPKK